MGPKKSASKLRSKWGSVQTRSSPRFREASSMDIDSAAPDSSSYTPAVQPETAYASTNTLKVI